MKGLSLAAISVENIREVVLGEKLDVLLASGTEAVEEIIDVGLGELVAILELSLVVIDVVVLLNSLDDVALALKLQELFGDHDVRVIDVDEEVAEIAIIPFEVGRVAEGALVVRNGPLGSGHHAQVVVPVSVHAGDERVLGESTLLNYPLNHQLVFFFNVTYC